MARRYGQVRSQQKAVNYEQSFEAVALDGRQDDFDMQDVAEASKMVRTCGRH